MKYGIRCQLYINFLKKREYTRKAGEGEEGQSKLRDTGSALRAQTPRHTSSACAGGGGVQTEGQRRCRSLSGVSPSTFSGACAPFPGQFDEPKVRSGRHARKLQGFLCPSLQDHIGSSSLLRGGGYDCFPGGDGQGRPGPLETCLEPLQATRHARTCGVQQMCQVGKEPQM